MSQYVNTWVIRYAMPSIQQQIETATVHAASDIFNEDPATPDHTNRLNWANWANENSTLAWVPFGWPVALNPAIESSVETDPSGQSVKDSDIQFVVNSNLTAVIADFVANPPKA